MKKQQFTVRKALEAIRFSRRQAGQSPEVYAPLESA